MKNTCKCQDILKIEHLGDLPDKQKIYNQLNLTSYLKECKKPIEDIFRYKFREWKNAEKKYVIILNSVSNSRSS